MTRPAQARPIPIPISALLPPSTSSTPLEPSQSLPSPSAAILGPLPPTSALHLALNWIALSDLPEYDTKTDEGGSSRIRSRALIITGPRANFADPIEEDDEDWLRDYGGCYGVLDRLNRVNTRSVKTDIACCISDYVFIS